MRRKIYSNDVNAANCLRLSSKNRVFEFKLCEYINHIDSTKFWANKARDSIKIHQTQIYCYRSNGQKGVFRVRTIKCKWQLTKRGLIITQAICCVFFSLSLRFDNFSSANIYLIKVGVEYRCRCHCRRRRCRWFFFRQIFICVQFSPHHHHLTERWLSWYIHPPEIKWSVIGDN